jgi:hypothetical protein
MIRTLKETFFNPCCAAAGLAWLARSLDLASGERSAADQVFFGADGRGWRREKRGAKQRSVIQKCCM